MTHRFLLYPLVLIAAMQLVPLLRRDARWFGAQVTQLAVILIAALAAMIVGRGIWVSWALFMVFIIAPRVLLWMGKRKRAVRATWWAGRLMMGKLGAVYRDYATGRLDQLLEQPMPARARGMVRVWQLTSLVEQRAWRQVVEFFGGTPEWGTLGAATEARLVAARAFAELREFERAWRCVQFVLLSPAVTRFEEESWMARVRVAALAGDATELARLLEAGRKRRGFERFAVYWRGRCALAAGQQTEAVRLLTKAYALTHPRDRMWGQAVRFYLEQAERGPITAVVRDEGYERGLAGVRLAEEQTRTWRALLGSRQLAPATIGLIAVCVAVLLGESFLSSLQDERFVRWAANGSMTVTQHQWWRLWTALLVHGNWLHLLMNGIGLWIFGGAVERASGWWRMLVVFLMAGAWGNLVSALVERYDLAVGASAGVFGLVGAFTVAIWRLKGTMYAALRWRLLRILLLMVAVDFVIGGLEPQVDNLAHVGGFMAGIGLAAMLCVPKK